MADVYFTYFSAWDVVICICCCWPKRLLLCHEINWLLFCSSLGFVVNACAFVCFYYSALSRDVIGFHFVPRDVFVCSLHTIVGLCLLLFQQGWPKRICSSLRTCWLFAYTFAWFLFVQAQKASAPSRNVIGLYFVPLTYFHIPFIVFIWAGPKGFCSLTRLIGVLFWFS